MGVFQQFPYSNFHEMNMDWILERLGKILSVEESEKVKQEIEQLANDIRAAGEKAVQDAERAAQAAQDVIEQIAIDVAEDRSAAADSADNAFAAAQRAEAAAARLDDVAAEVEAIVDEKVETAIAGIDVGYTPDKTIILTQGLHYGDTLPETVTPGRLFFVKVGG